MSRSVSVADVVVEVAESISIGVVVARGCELSVAKPGLDEAIAIAVSAAKNKVRGPTEDAVRNMLRHGKYKPTGRGKPASEYLVKAAVEDRFPRVNALVDVLNLVSLHSSLPISLIDLRLAQASRFVVRRGRAGEAYVFNQAGQSIELEDLLLVATLPLDQPCANPVKDSMRTKLVAESADVVAVLYAPHGLAKEPTEQLAREFERFATCSSVALAVI